MGSDTRQQQDKVIDILAKLIKEAEERECNCRGGSKGIDSDTVKRLTRGGPQSPWSRLREKDRDPVYSAIKEKFPARYQQLIEQYYKSFQDDGE